MGDIHIKLFPSECPRTVENFSVKNIPYHSVSFCFILFQSVLTFCNLLLLLLVNIIVGIVLMISYWLSIKIFLKALSTFTLTLLLLPPSLFLFYPHSSPPSLLLTLPLFYLPSLPPSLLPSLTLPLTLFYPPSLSFTLPLTLSYSFLLISHCI